MSDENTSNYSRLYTGASEAAQLSPEGEAVDAQLTSLPLGVTLAYRGI